MQTYRAERFAAGPQPVAEEVSGVSPAAQRRAPTLAPSRPLPLDWTLSAPRTLSRRELAAIVLLSALVHGGVATAGYRNHGTPTRARRLSRVEIEIARPPQIPKPVLAAPPPPPPKEQPRQPKPAATSQPALAPPVDTKPAEEPVDTGSSSPSSDDGELFAGKGGLGSAPPTPAPAAPPIAAPAPVIQAREGANYANNPRPAYPVRAKREGWQGTTLLRVQVQPSGKPAVVKIQKSSGHDVLDDAALEAVQKWTFVPATQGGAPVAGYVTVPLVFRLQ